MGFQVLLKSGILPGGGERWSDSAEPEATLTWNENGRYTALWTTVRVQAPQNVFLNGIDTFDLPIAHAEGPNCPIESGTIDRMDPEWPGGDLLLRPVRRIFERTDQRNRTSLSTEPERVIRQHCGI